MFVFAIHELQGKKCQHFVKLQEVACQDVEG
jgi:hypothetical protein